VLCDRRGALHRGRTDLSPVKQEIAERTNLRGRSGPLASVLAGAEVFIGVSGGTVPAGAVATMAKGAVIFALANPEPEIPPQIAAKYASVVATGRSDVGRDRACGSPGERGRIGVPPRRRSASPGAAMNTAPLDCRQGRAVWTAAGSRIVSLGHYQPTRVLTNHDLEGMVATSDAWIRSRVGIETRRIAAPDETVDAMAAHAAEKALAGSGLGAADIDMVLVTSCTAADRSPNMAARVAARLGLSAPAALDLNVACSGFVHALAVADQAIRAGSAANAMVIAAEQLSAVTDWTDRTTCVLVGDGDGAAVVSAAPASGVSPVLWGSTAAPTQLPANPNPPCHFLIGGCLRTRDGCVVVWSLIAQGN
jgi:hypothetical protein